MLNRSRHPLHGDAKQKPMDLGFIALLFLVATSGLALWLGRGTPALALLLCLHLGAVMALFVTLPYGKFAHGIFRTAALLRHDAEKRQPNPIGLGADWISSCALSIPTRRPSMNKRTLIQAAVTGHSRLGFGQSCLRRRISRPRNPSPWWWALPQVARPTPPRA